MSCTCATTAFDSPSLTPVSKTPTPTTYSYFTKDSQRGVCIFRRRQTPEQGQRGFRLSSLGILLAPSVRPRPWRHVAALKVLAQEIYTPLEQDARELQEGDWAPAQQFFEERRVRSTDLGGAGDWHRWSEEVHDSGDGVSCSFLLLSSVSARDLQDEDSPFMICAMNSNDSTRWTCRRTSTPRSTYHTSSVCLDPRHSRCTSTCLAAGAYSFTRSPLSSLRACSVR